MKLTRYIILLTLAAGLVAGSLHAETRDLKSLEGTWVAYEWNGEAAPIRYELEIRRTELRVDVTLRRSGEVSRSFEGYLSQGAAALRVGGFRMEPVGDGRSLVELDGPDFGPRDLELVFWKERI